MNNKHNIDSKKIIICGKFFSKRLEIWKVHKNFVKTILAKHSPCIILFKKKFDLSYNTWMKFQLGNNISLQSWQHQTEKFYIRYSVEFMHEFRCVVYIYIYIYIMRCIYIYIYMNYLFPTGWSFYLSPTWGSFVFLCP